VERGGEKRVVEGQLAVPLWRALTEICQPQQKQQLQPQQQQQRLLQQQQYKNFIHKSAKMPKGSNHSTKKKRSVVVVAAEGRDNGEGD